MLSSTWCRARVQRAVEARRCNQRSLIGSLSVPLGWDAARVEAVGVQVGLGGGCSGRLVRIAAGRILTALVRLFHNPNIMPMITARVRPELFA